MFKRIREHVGLRKRLIAYAALLDTKIAEMESEEDRKFMAINSLNDREGIRGAAEIIIPLNTYRNIRHDLYRSFGWLGRGRSVRELEKNASNKGVYLMKIVR